MTLLLFVAAWQNSDPLVRNAEFMRANPSLTFEYRVVFEHLPGAGEATLQIKRPDAQRFVCNWGTEKFRFIQNAGGLIAVRDDAKVYAEGGPKPQLVGPPPLAGMAELAHPAFLLAPSVRGFDRGASPRQQGTEVVNGLSCDVVQFDGTSELTAGNHKFWIDGSGRVLRYALTQRTDVGTVTTTYDFKSIEAGVANGAFEIALPIGYVPASGSSPFNIPRPTAQPAVFGLWRDGRTGKPVDTKAQFSAKPVAIVFTAPDCEISSRAEPFLVELRRALKAKGCALIEVSFGDPKTGIARKDKDRQLFYDHDGAIEAAYSPPGTPYFLLVNKAGFIVRGWQGYTKEHDRQIRATLLEGLTSN